MGVVGVGEWIRGWGMGRVGSVSRPGVKLTLGGKNEEGKYCLQRSI